MIISTRPLALLQLLIFFAVGCKTNEPVSPAILPGDEKVAVIESNDTKLASDDDYPLEGDIDKWEGIRAYAGSQALGDQRIDLKFWIKGTGFTFVNLHDNENTSVMAARLVIDSVGGRLIELQHSGERNIQFKLNSTAFEFDPNRMFTDLGAKTSLEQYSKMSNRAHRSIRTLAQRVVDSLDRRMIVTLHNNSDENYSSLSYLDEYANDAAAVFINPTRDADDFFFVTTWELFEKFKNLGYNTVLQNNATMTDDGSLSVLAGIQDIPYINVEAEHGHFDEQVEMMFALMKVLSAE